MVNSGLVGIVKDSFNSVLHFSRRVAIVGSAALALTFVSCEPDDPIVPDNRSPVSTLTLDKYSGLAPLDVGISPVAHDADGDSDITNYSMSITNGH